MTINELTDLMRRESAELDPASAERILDRALAGGARWRLGRKLMVGASAAIVLGVALTGAGLASSGSARRDPEEDNASAAGSPTPQNTYTPGSATQVPGGPVIRTDRAVVDDAALLAATRDALPASGAVTDLQVEHVASTPVHYVADETQNGRRVLFTFNGAGASITIQRWDGYAAVGIDLDELKTPNSASHHRPSQKVATTAREACAGSYRVFPAIRCEEATEGWYSVERPSQGSGAPYNTYRELTLTLYTPDGYVIQVDSFNTPGEKAGPLISDSPALTLPQSLALARNPRWFVGD